MGFFTLGYTNLDLERKQRNIPLKRTLLIGVLKSSFIFSPFQTTGQTFLTKFIFCRVFLQTCHVLMTRSAALHCNTTIQRFFMTMHLHGRDLGGKA